MPYGMVLLDGKGAVLGGNRTAEELLEQSFPETTTLRCCSLFGCGRRGTPLAGTCLTKLAREKGETLPEIRLDVPSENPKRAAWVTAVPLEAHGEQVLLHLRPGDLRDRRRRTEPHWMGEPSLRVWVLGQTMVERGTTFIGGSWVAQRPGQLLKYLVCERDRVVPAEEIAEAIWPNGDPTTVLGRVRHYVHALRRQVEPERAKHSQSAFIVAHPRGYALARDRVELDVDEFERHAAAGLRAREDERLDVAGEHLRRAIDLYRGDFLADEPFADWAFAERERLRDLMGRALRSLADIALGEDELATAAEQLERLASLHPFDTHVQRDVMALCLRRGKRSEAMRRYTSFRARLQRQFGEELDFTMEDLVESENRRSRRA
jgi:DNA-binding SARP family transcriptional activator